MNKPISDEMKTEIRLQVRLKLAQELSRESVTVTVKDLSALLARLDKAEAQLRRISRWERYGGEDSEPLVYPKDIALAYFAPSPPKGS